MTVTYYSDRFLESGSDVALQSHTPDVGSSLGAVAATVYVKGSSVGYAEFPSGETYNSAGSLGHADGQATIVYSGRDVSTNSVGFQFRRQGDGKLYQWYIDIDGNKLHYYNGTSWVELVSHATASSPDTTQRTIVVTWTGSTITVVYNGTTVVNYTTATQISAAGGVAVWASNARLYDMVVTDASGSVPTIDTQPTAQTANEPSTAGFTVAATTSGGTLTYQWKRAEPGSGTYSNVSTGTGGTSASYTTAATSAASDHGASYKCTVTDSNGSTDTDAVTLTVRSTTTTARPSADVTTSGWTTSTGSDFFALLDEVTYDDADYVTSPTLSGSTAPLVVQLKYPINTATWTVGCRASTSSGTATLTAYLLNDSDTVVGTSSGQTITATPTSYSLPITLSGPATRLKIAIVV